MSKKGNKPEKPEPPAGSCHFYIERKRRYCRFHPTKETTYCAEHAAILGKDLDRKRVQCPYDVKHTCYIDKLNHHMKKCPSRPREMPAYHCAGINSGDDAGELVPDPKETVLTVAVEELVTIVDKVNRLYDEHIGELKEDILTHNCLQKELGNTTYGTAALRHRRQQASLIGQMEKQGLLKDGICYLEMGAGKGQLSHWLHGAVKECKDIGFVLIDRSHVRNKMDNLHKEEQIMERIRMDIEHLRLEHVPSIEKHKRPVVAFGKHLCGPATDLSLRCIMETLSSTTERDNEETKRKRFKSDQRDVAGTVIALCCHHRCTWKPYVGKTFFKSCGLTARDFQLLSSMSSWATCTWKGWSHTRKEENKTLRVENKHGGDEIEGGDRVLNKEVVDNTGSVEIEGKDSMPVVGNTGTVPSNEDREETMNETAANTSTDDKEVAVVDDDAGGHGPQDDATNTSINVKLSPEEREVVGWKCKRLIDHGRVRYMQEHGMTSSLKVYIESFYTPENVALVASS